MSDHYTVLARRYRPQTFDDVVGQGHVGAALRNAIASDRIAHAYLFTGARGVGKTSTARIFAKALNCPNVADGVPCNACEVCDAIGAGNDVDVLEIDGASNNGVENIRELRANVGIRPMRSPRKVYIIDEVHMLSNAAFNALLKTLEEPPPNVNFVFCTTEPQKVPDTIHSRCQRFDFGTIEADKITDRLTEIAAAEGKQVEPEAVAMVARRAGGSMRDSQSLFDQLLAFGGETITADDVHKLFGTAPDERMIELIESLMASDRAAALSMLDDAMTAGVRLEALTDQMVAYVRDLMVLAGGAAEAELMGVGEPHRAAIQDQATRWGLRTATAALQILADTKLKMARTVHARPLFELALVRMTLLDDLEQLAELVARLRQNPSGLSSDGAGAGSGKKKVDSAAVASAAADGAVDRAAAMKAMLAAQRRPSSEPRAEAPASMTEPPLEQHEPSNSHDPIHEAEAQAGVQPTSEPREEPGNAAPAPQPEPSSNGRAITADNVDRFLQALIKRLPDVIAKPLNQAKNAAVTTPDHVVVTLPGNNVFAKQNLQRTQTKQQINTAATALAGHDVTVDVRFDAAAQPAPQATVRKKIEESSRRDVASVESDPFVQKVLEAFGGGMIVQVTAQSLAIPSPTGDASGFSDSDIEHPFDDLDDDLD